MKHKWVSFPILIACIGIIVLFYKILPKETAPYDDRSMVMVNVNGPEGATYDYMDSFMQELSQLISDSIPEKR